MKLLRDTDEADAFVGRRRRRCFLGEEVADFVAGALKEAAEKNIGVRRLLHAGTVPNCYNYPAFTQALLVAAWPDGRALAFTSEIPANKATLSGAIAELFGDLARPLADGRFSDGKSGVAERLLWDALRKIASEEKNLWKGNR